MNVSGEYYILAKFMPRGRVPRTLCDSWGLKGDTQGTRMTWGLNLGDGNITNKADMAQSIFRAFSPESETTGGGVTLEFIELGMSPEPFLPTVLTRWLRGRKRA